MNDLATFMQVDLQNLFYGARSYEQKLENINRDKRSGQAPVKVKIDFEKIWIYFNDRNSEFLTDAIVYLIKGEEFDSNKFETKIKSIGYKTKSKTLMKIVKNKDVFFQQTNNTVGITVDCVSRINTFDKWILMSGNGDFVDLCKYLHQKKKKIEIWSFKECFSSTLEPYADKVHFISKDFLYKSPIVSVFGFNWNIIDEKR